jgi:hypothetical protein
MDRVLQIFLIVCLLLFLVIILRFLAKKRLNLKYSLTWLLAGIGMLLIAIFPQIVYFVGNVVGIAAPVNTVFLFGGMFIILILLTLTFAVSHLNERMCKMAQSIALLEKRLRELEGL